MIYWIPIDFYIPIPIPTLGMVAWWLVVGDMVLLAICAERAKKSWRRKKKPTPPLVACLLVPVLWPLPVIGAILDIRDERRIKQFKQDNIKAYTQHHIQED